MPSLRPCVYISSSLSPDCLAFLHLLFTDSARAMNEAPVSCLPVQVKMSKARKALAEAREIKNPELDLVDKGIHSFEELPGLCEYKNSRHAQIW